MFRSRLDRCSQAVDHGRVQRIGLVVQVQSAIEEAMLVLVNIVMSPVMCWLHLVDVRSYPGMFSPWERAFLFISLERTALCQM